MFSDEACCIKYNYFEDEFYQQANESYFDRLTYSVKVNSVIYDIELDTKTGLAKYYNKGMEQFIDPSIVVTTK